MQQDSPKSIVKPLLVLTIISTIFSIGVVITLIAQSSTGFGATYNVSATCNTYLSIKYQVQKEKGYQVRFIISIIAMICLGVESILNIQSFLKIRNIQQLNMPQIYQWSQSELNMKFICQALAATLLLPLFVFYLSITAQQGKCFQSIYANWLLILFQSGVSFILTIVCLIIIIIFSVSRPNDNAKKYQTNINMDQFRRNQIQMKNVFEMEGQQLYKTVKRQNRDFAQPLLYENAPIPLLQSQLGKVTRKQSIIDRFNDEANHVPTLTNAQNQPLRPPPTLTQRKKSMSPQKIAPNPFTKSRFSAMIEMKKNKFRQINPLKPSLSNKHKNENQVAQQQYEEVIGENKMKNLPKAYIEYIKQAKKPKRNPPNIQLILQNYNNQERARILAELAKEEKPFLKRYRKEKEIKVEKKKEDNQQIQFIDQFIKDSLPILVQNQPQQQEQQQKQESNEPELFFHKPRIDKSIKKRKLLFEEQVDTNKFVEESDSKQLIINKLRQAKINKSKMNLRTQVSPQAVKSPKRKNTIKSKQDIMLSFLKSKFLSPQPQEVQQDVKQQEQ